MIEYIPGHSTSRQDSTSVGSPLQIPPYVSSVILTRVLVFWPGPHVVEQVPLTHASQTQSTKISYMYLYKCACIL